MNLINSTVGMLVLSVPFLMAANIVGGALVADFKGKFEWGVVKRSVVKYGGLLVMGGLLYAGGKLSTEGFKQALDVELYLDEIVLVGIATYGLTYATQAVQKFSELAGLKMDGKDNDNEVE